MAQTIDIEAIRKLTVAERVALIDRIRETLIDDDALPLPDALLDEMERRAAELDADPSKAIPHEEMMKRLRARQ
jgi:putative addiction module component (TIGR02574 family)